ncbi:MAG: 3-oxoacyl-[acyl-carrier-protein] synthase III C-terminal domain-containing protein [Ketobacteraceae bacterium]|nr:3-oxoacyl-[acyl-carrier-protein] synthase III C-terminal domain-containing protein [Ketobacteraceae bacterium]
MNEPRQNSILCSIAYKLGKLSGAESIQDFDDAASKYKLPADPGLLDFGSYSTVETDIYELAVECAKETLSRLPAGKLRPDAVILTTNSFLESPQLRNHRMSELLIELDLGGAIPFCLSFSECANFHSALQIAISLLSQDQFDNILVITADKADSYGERITEYGVLSDGAASCIITGEIAQEAIEHSYRIQSLVQRSVPTPIGERNLASFVYNYRDVFNLSIDKGGIGFDDVTWAIHNNFFAPWQNALKQLLMVDESKVYFDNVHKFGHSFAADNLINLRELEKEQLIGGGNNIVLTSSGVGHFGSACLEKL